VNGPGRSDSPSGQEVNATSTARSRSEKAAGVAAFGPCRIRRGMAAVLDVGIAGAFMLPAAAMSNIALEFLPKPALAMWIPLLPALYMLLRDSLRGQSAGKAFTRIVVVDEASREPAGALHSLVRNAPYVVLLAPVYGWYGLGFVALLLGGQVLIWGRHLGDGWSETRVMKESDFERLTGERKA
jgi:hypothetical protein